jgi:hypothetical protein
LAADHPVYIKPSGCLSVTPKSKEVYDVARKAHSLRIVLTAASAALVLALVPTALAGKGGQGGDKGTAPSGRALAGVVDRSAGTYTVTGTGFKSGEVVGLTIGEAGGCCNATNIVPDGSGAFTVTRVLVGAGTYFVWASELVNRKWTIVAKWSTQV